jgi:hypothetical protein
MCNNNFIALFDEIKLQTEALLPVINAFRKELGKDHANQIAYKALRPYIQKVYHQLGEQQNGKPLEKWEKVWNIIRPRIGDIVERNFSKNDDDGRDYKVTRCKFAEYFKEIGEPELGMIFMCDFDYYIAEIGAPAVELTRTQTIMEGADHCDFRYCFNKAK